MIRLRRRIAAAPLARKRTPRNASGIKATMMSALKMTADKIAEWGLARCITFSARSGGKTLTNIAGTNAKNLAMSLVIENVVRHGVLGSAVGAERVGPVPGQ